MFQNLTNGLGEGFAVRSQEGADAFRQPHKVPRLGAVKASKASFAEGRVGVDATTLAALVMKNALLGAVDPDGLGVAVVGRDKDLEALLTKAGQQREWKSFLGPDADRVRHADRAKLHPVQDLVHLVHRDAKHTGLGGHDSSRFAPASRRSRRWLASTP